MKRGLVSLFFYANLVIVVSILLYKVYIYATAPEASALLLKQIEKIETQTAQAESVTFAVVGEANNSIGLFERQIVPMVNASDASFLVSAGSIVSAGGEDKYRALLETLAHLNKPYLLTFGEHEYDEFGSVRFYQRFGPHFFAVTLPQVTLVFLDSTGRTPIDWQERWLHDILETETERQVIVFTGHPLVDPERETFFEPDRGAWSPPIDRNRLLDLLTELGVDAVISAGAATFSDRSVNGIRHILTGGAGGFVINDEYSFHHYLEVGVSDKGIDVDIVRLDAPPTIFAQRVESLWFFLYSLFYVGIWNFLLIFSAFMIVGIFLFNRLFRTPLYYPSYDTVPPILGRQLRIAMFTNSYLPFIGGISISVERLKKGLERQGHDVRVICPRNTNVAADRTVLRVPVVFRFGEMFQISNPFHSAASRSVREFKPDIIHVHHPYGLGRLGLKIGRKLNVPVIYTYHTRLEQFAHAIPFFGILFRNILSHWIVQRFASLCNEIIVPTPVTRDYIRLIGVDRPVHVLPTGVELERYEFGDISQLQTLEAKVNPDHRLLLITVSRLSKEKNINFIVEAMTHLKHQDLPPFCLIILGDGDERIHIEQLIREKGLTDIVRLLGSIPYEDVPAYLKISTVFVYASSSETQGMVILESMAAGLPVVAVNSSGIDAFVQDRRTGYVTTENIEAWTETLSNVLRNAEERKVVAQAAQKTAQSYSIDAFASGAIEVYRSALGSRSGK